MTDAGASVSRRPSLAMLVAITAMGPLALNIFMPSMPGLEGYFGVPYGVVQLTLSVYLVGMAVSQLVYGPLSDRFGRRPLVLFGLVVFVAGSLLAMIAPTVEVLIVARFLQSIGGSAGLVLGRAIVRDLYDRDAAAGMIAYMTMAMVVAPMIAPVLGGVLDETVGWRFGFLLIALTGGVVVTVAVSRLHETNHDPVSLPGLRGVMASYADLVRRPAFIGYTLQTAAITAGFFAFLGGAPYVVVGLMGYSPGAYGLFFMMTAAGYMAGNFTAGRLSTRLGVDRMMTWGVLITLSGSSLMLLAALVNGLHPATLFGPMAVMAFGNGMALPNGMAGAVSVNPRLAGAASGLSGFVQMGLGAGLSILVGYLVTDSALPMLVAMTLAGICALAAHVFTLRFNRSARELAGTVS